MVYIGKSTAQAMCVQSSRRRTRHGVLAIASRLTDAMRFCWRGSRALANSGDATTTRSAAKLGSRHRLESAGAAMHAIPPNAGAQKEGARRHHRYRP
jgi:hypothetical protein